MGISQLIDLVREKLTEISPQKLGPHVKSVINIHFNNTTVTIWWKEPVNYSSKPNTMSCIGLKLGKRSI